MTVFLRCWGALVLDKCCHCLQKEKAEVQKFARSHGLEEFVSGDMVH